MKRTLALIIAALCIAAPAIAQTPGHLLSAVQPGRVVEVSATMGMLDNSRAWTGQGAQDAVTLAKAVEVEFKSSDKIQPWTWDWITNTPRTDVTPLKFSIAVKEAWSVEGAPVEYNRYNVLACYDVALVDVYHCRQYQGSSGDEYLSSHINSMRMWRDDGDALVAALFAEEKTGMENETLIIVVLGIVGLGALGVFAYYGKKLGEVAALVEPLARAALAKADVALAPMGAELLPIHDGFSVLGSLVDEDSDVLAQKLPPDILAAVRVVLAYGKSLTDGEAQPLAEKPTDAS